MAANGQPRADAWRHEAAEARAMAAGFQDLEAQRSMLEVASAYDLLAKLEEGMRATAAVEQAGPAPT